MEKDIAALGVDEKQHLIETAGEHSSDASHQSKNKKSNVKLI